MEVSQIRKGVLLLIYCLVSEIHNVPPGGDSLKQAHYEFRETSRQVTEQEIVGGT